MRFIGQRAQGQCVIIGEERGGADADSIDDLTSGPEAEEVREAMSYEGRATVRALPAPAGVVLAKVGAGIAAAGPEPERTSRILGGDLMLARDRAREAIARAVADAAATTRRQFVSSIATMMPVERYQRASTGIRGVVAPGAASGAAQAVPAAPPSVSEPKWGRSRAESLVRVTRVAENPAPVAAPAERPEPVGTAKIVARPSTATVRIAPPAAGPPTAPSGMHSQPSPTPHREGGSTEILVRRAAPHPPLGVPDASLDFDLERLESVLAQAWAGYEAPSPPGTAHRAARSIADVAGLLAELDVLLEDGIFSGLIDAAPTLYGLHSDLAARLDRLRTHPIEIEATERQVAEARRLVDTVRERALERLAEAQREHVVACVADALRGMGYGDVRSEPLGEWTLLRGHDGRRAFSVAVTAGLEIVFDLGHDGFDSNDSCRAEAQRFLDILGSGCAIENIELESTHPRVRQEQAVLQLLARLREMGAEVSIEADGEDVVLTAALPAGVESIRVSVDGAAVGSMPVAGVEEPVRGSVGTAPRQRERQR